jgi:hypothetical protein
MPRRRTLAAFAGSVKPFEEDQVRHDEAVGGDHKAEESQEDVDEGELVLELDLDLEVVQKADRRKRGVEEPGAGLDEGGGGVIRREDGGDGTRGSGRGDRGGDVVDDGRSGD